jgi:hypothetical protein
MQTLSNNLKTILDLIQSYTFLDRIFRWKKLKSLLIDAYTELQRISSNSEFANEKIQELKNENAGLKAELEFQKATVSNNHNEIVNLKSVQQDYIEKINLYAAERASFETNMKNLSANLVQAEKELEIERNNLVNLTNEKTNLSNENATLKESCNQLTSIKNKSDQELALLNKDLENLRNELAEVTRQNTIYKADEEHQKNEYQKNMSALSELQMQLNAEREAEKHAVYQAEIERIENLKTTWKNHQDAVKLSIKAICNKHAIEYIDKVPFKGEPDNTIMICDEYIIFDAKSPKTDDLRNFPTYLQTQAESAKKYATQENVKRWIFFVIPANTYEVLDKYVYELSDFTIYVISHDALEPVILSMKKIEEYDFAEQLSPEDRENICRTIGKFVHTTKRLVQFGNFTNNQLIDLIYFAERNLPTDMFDDIKKFESQDKINPPMEKRAKTISVLSLESEVKIVKNHADNLGINTNEDELKKELTNFSLYKNGKEAE